ncbi:MAG: hypothetical protein RLN78_04765 [Phycisphaerales bacterium]
MNYIEPHTEVDDMIRNGMLLLALVAGLASAEPITYQGQLFFAGEPASGLFDLECRVFDSAIDGMQLGETVVVEDHLIPDGALSVVLEFGDVFDAGDAYIEFSIRAGESEDMYNTLFPRQRITATPKAVHALTADAISGAGWQLGTNPFGQNEVLQFGDGNDRVVINRDAPILPFEYLGVHLDNIQTGGIVISNEDPMRSTIFAHVTGGVVGASQSFNGETSKWTLQISGANSITAGSGGVEIATAVTAPSYSFTEPKLQAVTVAGDVFHSALGTPFRASFFGGGAYLSTPGDNAPLVAPIALPHGATITKLTARYEDNAASDLAVSLNSARSDGSMATVAGVSTMGIAPVAGIRSLETVEITKGSEVVDAFSTGYYLRVFSSSWPGDSSMRIWSVTVQYTVDAPN